MNRIMLFFVLIVCVILGGSAVYLVARLGSAFPLSGTGLRWSMLLCTLLALMMPALLAARRLTETNLRWPLLLAYAVFGLFSILLAFTLFRDLLWLLARLLTLLPIDAAIRSLFFAWSSRIVLAFGLLVFLGGVFVASQPPRVREVDVRIPGLHEDLRGLRIVQLSDIHLDQITPPGFLEEIVSRANNLHPDLVALTGDLVDGRVSELASQANALKKLNADCYFVTGNHELYSGVTDWTGYLQQIGVQVLDQRHVLVTHGAARLLLAGVSDYSMPQMFPGSVSDPAAALENAPEHDCCILLAHQPSSARAALQAGADLVLAGHTHGGQYFPFSLLISLFQPFARGLHQIGDAFVYTSPGTGTWGPPLRLGARHEITLLHLR